MLTALLDWFAILSGSNACTQVNDLQDGKILLETLARLAPDSWQPVAQSTDA